MQICGLSSFRLPLWCLDELRTLLTVHWFSEFSVRTRNRCRTISPHQIEIYLLTTLATFGQLRSISNELWSLHLYDNVFMSARQSLSPLQVLNGGLKIPPKSNGVVSPTRGFIMHHCCTRYWTSQYGKDGLISLSKVCINLTIKINFSKITRFFLPRKGYLTERLTLHVWITEMSYSKLRFDIWNKVGGKGWFNWGYSCVVLCN